MALRTRLLVKFRAECRLRAKSNECWLFYLSHLANSYRVEGAEGHRIKNKHLRNNAKQQKKPCPKIKKEVDTSIIINK